MTCLHSPFAAAEGEPTLPQDGQSHPDGNGGKWCVCEVRACVHAFRCALGIASIPMLNKLELSLELSSDGPISACTEVACSAAPESTSAPCSVTATSAAHTTQQGTESGRLLY